MGRKKVSVSGIYMVYNRVDAKAYICASRNVQRAMSQLKYMLKNHKCVNVTLQQDWDTLGEDGFDFVVLEKCFPQDFYEYKKKWINIYNATNELSGYNNPDYTYVTMGMDDITRRAIGETQKERWKERNGDFDN